MNNPANDIKDSMWDFLKDGKQEPNIEALKDGVYTLIKMTTQKDAGQRGTSENVPFAMLDIVNTVANHKQVSSMDELPIADVREKIRLVCCQNHGRSRMGCQ